MKVKLLKDHTHNDVPHKAGDIIDVSPAAAAWMADHKVIAAGDDKKPPVKPAG